MLHFLIINMEGFAMNKSDLKYIGKKELILVVKSLSKRIMTSLSKNGEELSIRVMASIRRNAVFKRQVA